MIKHCVFASLLCVFLLPAVSQEPKTGASDSCSNPAAVSKMVNPVKPTAESLAQGKKYYGYDCAMCHGQSGDGKGEVENGGKLPDFSNAATMKDMSDGEMFCSLKNGKGHMPHENIRVTPNELWNLINYVRSLGK
jgi:mono/diheme cytochrome c family protein